MYLVFTTNSQTYTIVNKIAFDYYVIIKLSAMCKALLAMQRYTRNYSSTVRNCYIWKFLWLFNKPYQVNDNYMPGSGVDVKTQKWLWSNLFNWGPHRIDL